ncbi:MAG: hypothetical protein KatS3mg061_1270 [Dehalococcoidia bacterium]|nr:MAG: hypothetical protein KatS3mg061_1270 [Dehalococcoidia bacterium]
MATDEQAITLGHPSYLWRYGQERRLQLIRAVTPLEGGRILDIGCGVGMYLRAFRRFSDEVYGVEYEQARAVAAGRETPTVARAVAEQLPFPDTTFDVVLLHEVIEHVRNDRQTVREAHRVTKWGAGVIVIFAPQSPVPLRDPRRLLPWPRLCLRQHPLRRLAAGPAAPAVRSPRAGRTCRVKSAASFVACRAR